MENPVFPDPHCALDEPNGLLAMGGNLKPETLMQAYSQGIFPWYEDQQPLLWWSPDPRAVFEPGKLKISRSLTKSLRQKSWQITTDTAFKEVVCACAEPRPYAEDTWITQEMLAAYIALHQQGHAHSIEVWFDGRLVGGLYGIVIGAVFCGESMFHRTSNASKVALVHLDKIAQQQNFELIDCQMPNKHLLSLGAKTLSRHAFLQRLCILRERHCRWPDRANSSTVET